MTVEFLLTSLIVIVSPLTAVTLVPGAIAAPETGMPTARPETLARVSVVAPGSASAVVVVLIRAASYLSPSCCVM